MIRVGQMFPARITDHLRSAFFHAGYAIRDDGAIFDFRPDWTEVGDHPRDQFWRWVGLMQERGLFRVETE